MGGSPSKQNSPIPQPQQQQQNRCRAIGCQQNHSSHYCRSCGTQNSTHLTRNCILNNQPPGVPLKCKVPGCTENHMKHYCRTCDDDDSDHFGRNCNQGGNQGRPASSNKNQNPFFDPKNMPSRYNQKINKQSPRPQYFNQTSYNHRSNYQSVQSHFQPRIRSNTQTSMKSQVQSKANNSLTKKSNTQQQNSEIDQLVKDIAILSFSDPLAAILLIEKLKEQIGQNDQGNQDQDNDDNRAIKCKVRGCFLMHNAHICRFCQDQDCDHFQDQCMVKVQKETQYFNLKDQKLKSMKKMTCKVKGCQSSHINHFCMNCKSQTADHLDLDCPKIKGKPKLKCRAPGCTENHSKHYCRLCQKSDTTHLGRDCPQGVLCYHGTSQDCAEAIQRTKMLPSKFGNLGVGIYFTPDKQAAIGIAKLRFQQAKSGKKQRPILITARIRKKQGFYKQKQHGVWRGATTKPFQQIAVTDDKYLRIEGYQYVD